MLVRLIIILYVLLSIPFKCRSYYSNGRKRNRLDDSDKVYGNGYTSTIISKTSTIASKTSTIASKTSTISSSKPSTSKTAIYTSTSGKLTESSIKTTESTTKSTAKQNKYASGDSGYNVQVTTHSTNSKAGSAIQDLIRNLEDVEGIISSFNHEAPEDKDQLIDGILLLERILVNVSMLCYDNTSASITTANMDLHVTSTEHLIESIQTNTSVELHRSNAAIHSATYLVSVAFLNFSSTRLTPLSADSVQVAKQLEAVREKFFFIPTAPHIAVNFISDKNKSLDSEVKIVFTNDANAMIDEQVLPDLGDSRILSASYECTFINTSTKLYSDFGCTTGANATSVTCICNHTTIFAVLLSVKYVKVPPGIKISSVIAESISVICLVFTIAILTYFRRNIRSDRTFVQINLSLSLLFLHLFNLLHDYAKLVNLLCQIFASCIHFFLLASGLWMMLEGITLVLKTTNSSMNIANQDTRKRNAIRFAIGWGLPMAIVSLAVAIGYSWDIYMDRISVTTELPVYNRCWLHQEMLLYFVIIPVGLVLLANTTILVKVAHFVHIKSAQSKRFKPTMKRRRSFANHEDISATLKAVLTLLPVLGLPWIISFLVGSGENAASVILMYANVLMNGLQGFFLFVLYCLNSREVRRLLLRRSPLAALDRRRQATSRTASTTISQIDTSATAMKVRDSNDGGASTKPT